MILIPKEENNMVYEIREWLRLIENSQEDEKSKIYEEASGNEMQGKRWESGFRQMFLRIAPCEKRVRQKQRTLFASQIQTRNESVCIC